MKKEGISRIVAAFVTLSILTILIVSGPADAYILGLTILNPEVNKGEIIDFTASVNVEQNEVLNISRFVLKLQGPVNDDCTFQPDGTVISGCFGIQIQQIETTNYNYGYGFTEGNLTYRILLDTSQYVFGIYQTSLGIIIGSQVIDQKGQDVIIRGPVTPLEGCSIRADDGSLLAEGKQFGESNINFYIPLKNAKNGKGALSAQIGKDRFSYKFNIDEIVENDYDSAVLAVSGKYKLGKNKYVKESALITFDKINRKISLISGNLTLFENKISFSKGC